MAVSDTARPEKDQPMADEAVDTVKGKGKGKRKAEPEAETCPSKKPNLNQGFRVFIGNLNKTKNYEEVKTALVNYLMTQSLLIQDIKIDLARAYAHVDLASEIDLTKALTLNGKKFLDLPMRISKAKVKDDDNNNNKKKNKRKVKLTAAQKADKFSKWLSVSNLPHSITKAELMAIFKTAVDVKFPGGAPGPSTGVAIVQFETKDLAEKAMKKKLGKKLKGSVMKIHAYRPKAAAVAGGNTRATAPANGATNTLIVKNLHRLENEAKLRTVFKKAVGINLPKDGSKTRGFAFVEFETVQDAEEAKKMAEGTKILQNEISVEYCRTKFRPVTDQVLLTTLMVTGLAEKTSEETLKTAFEGCTGARIIRDKGAKSKGFGFVDFAQKETCQAAKESMKDCEIDGKKVSLTYAKPRVSSPSPKPKNGDQPEAQPEDQPTEQPEDQPTEQPENDQTTGDKSRRSKRRRTKKKGPKPAAQRGAKEAEAKE